jgi:Tol biopolymer transport system component
LPSGRIVFNSDSTGNTGNWEIFLLDLNAAVQECHLVKTVPVSTTIWAVYKPTISLDAVNLTNDLADDARPIWLPDSSAISFASNRRGEPAIDIETGEEYSRYQPYTINPDGSALTFLATLDTAGSISSWSPDGNQVTYVSWTPEALAAGEPPTIWLANRDGSNQKLLTFGDDALWSPTGEWIAVLRWPYTSGDLDVSQVYLIRPDGSDGHLLLENTPPVRELVWSPNGNQLAMSTGDLLIVDIATQEIRRIDLDFNVRCTGWSPDGEWLACDDSRSIYGINPDDSWIIRFFGPAEVGLNQYPDWGR